MSERTEFWVFLVIGAVLLVANRPVAALYQLIFGSLSLRFRREKAMLFFRTTVIAVGTFAVVLSLSILLIQDEALAMFVAFVILSAATLAFHRVLAEAQMNVVGRWMSRIPEPTLRDLFRMLYIAIGIAMVIVGVGALFSDPFAVD
jgi:uncharacterized membrane protein YfcA